jgi:hypothetical protein
MKTVLDQIYNGAFNNIEYSAGVKKTTQQMAVITAIGILGSFFILMNKNK